MNKTNRFTVPMPVRKETAGESVRRKLSLLSLAEDVDPRVLTLADKLMQRDLARQPRMTADEAGRHLKDYLSAAAECVRDWQEQDRYSSFAG